MASLRSPPARSQVDLGLYVGLVVLWGPAELGVVVGPRQLLGPTAEALLYGILQLQKKIKRERKLQIWYRK